MYWQMFDKLCGLFLYFQFIDAFDKRVIYPTTLENVLLLYSLNCVYNLYNYLVSVVHPGGGFRAKAPPPKNVRL